MFKLREKNILLICVSVFLLLLNIIVVLKVLKVYYYPIYCILYTLVSLNCIVIYIYYTRKKINYTEFNQHIIQTEIM